MSDTHILLKKMKKHIYKKEGLDCYPKKEKGEKKIMEIDNSEDYTDI